MLDADGDGLSDELESVFGTDPTRVDTDRDGASDPYEFTQDSDPLSRKSVPGVEPSVRVHATELEGAVRVHVGVFPADLHLLDDFEIHLGSAQFEQGASVQRFRPFNFTPLLASCTTGLAVGVQHGLSVLTFSFDLPAEMMELFAPLTVAVSARLAGQVHSHQLQLSVLPGGERVMASQMLHGPLQSVTGALSYRMLPLSAVFTSGLDDPEYCELSLGAGTPIGVAGRKYLIEEAGCEPAGLTLCVQEECQDLVGGEILEVDRGYLQDRLD